MKYIAEVCAVLMDETERRYLKARAPEVARKSLQAWTESCY